VALDPRNGEVLALASRPTFDPNKFSVRIKSSDWKQLLDNPDHPLLNRAIQAQFAPVRRLNHHGHRGLERGPLTISIRSTALEWHRFMATLTSAM